MADLLFSILGDFNARRTGERSPLKLAELQERLLARLLVEDNKSVSQERLLEDLWGLDQAPNSLQQAVTRLRRALGDDGHGIISRTNAGYALDLHEHALDSLRFSKLARAGHAVLADRPHLAAIFLSEALATWRGPVLGMSDLPDWAQPHAHELDGIRDAAEVDLNDARFEVGEFVELESALRRQLATRPLDERRHRQLVLTLAAMGRIAEAGAHFRDAFLLMGTVSAEFQALAECISRGEIPTRGRAESAIPDPRAGAVILHATGSTSRAHGPGLGTLALLLEEAGGHPTPDGRSAMIAMFAEPAEAVAVARTLADHPFLRCAVGLHSGGVMWARDRMAGAGAERCRLIAGAAAPGQVLVSQAARRRIGPGTRMVDLGVHRYPDLLAGEVLYALPTATPQSELPRPATLGAVQHNLPVQSARFIGRADLLARLTQRAATGELISIVGPGGCGKTRLALQLAARSAPAFSDGVWFAGLAGLETGADVDEVALSVAMALRAPCVPMAASRETLIAHLADRHVLLILDNCEHVLDACRTLIVELLARCPHVCVVVTSRHRVGLDGEHVLQVPGMQAGETGTGELAEAIELLLERADEPVPPEEGLAKAAKMCQALEGSPLAIELVAAQVATRGMEGVVREVDAMLAGEQALSAFVSEDPRRPERQRTMEATIRWSHALLTDTQQRVFARLAVFSGAFGAAEADAVVGEPGTGEVLASLVDHSMVAALPAIAGEARFRLEIPIRAFARDQLRCCGGTAEARARHVAAYRGLAERVAPTLFGAGEQAGLVRLEADHDNLRAALVGLEEAGDGEGALAMVGDLWWWWFSRGHFDEGAEWVRRALATHTGEPCALRVRALRAGSHLTWWRGDYAQTAHDNAELHRCAQAIGDDWGLAWAPMAEGALLLFRDPGQALPLFEVSHARFAEDGHEWEAAYALQLVGGAHWFAGNPDRAGVAFEQAAGMFAALGHASVLASTRRGAGMMAALCGRPERGEALCHQALTLSERIGDRSGSAQALNFLGAIGRMSGALDAATDRYARALENARAVGELWATCAALDGLASLACADGDLALAVRLRTHSDALASRSAYRRSGPEAELRAADEQIIAAGLPVAGREAAAAEGELMETGEAILSALAFARRHAG